MGVFLRQPSHLVGKVSYNGVLYGVMPPLWFHTLSFLPLFFCCFFFPSFPHCISNLSVVTFSLKTIVQSFCLSTSRTTHFNPPGCTPFPTICLYRIAVSYLLHSIGLPSILFLRADRLFSRSASLVGVD